MGFVRIVLPVLSLAIAGLDVAVDAQKICTPSPVGIFYSGIPSQNTTSPSPDACSSLCASTTDCVAYNWGPFDGSSYCDMFSVRGAARTNQYLSSVLQAGRCSLQIPTVNGDFAGNDLANAPATDALQCSYTCDDTDGCYAFSWTTYNGGTCWMKKARSPTTSAPFDSTVVSGEPLKCAVSGWGTDIVGNDLASVPRADWRDCCGVCRRTTGCVASTWSNYNGGTCWLKKAARNFGKADGVILMELTN